MGMIASLARALLARGGLIRLGQAGVAVAGAFRPNATRQLELGHDAFVATQQAAEAEFRNARPGRFDGLVNGLNRLPRPMLALGTLGLFAYAMADPDGFTRRMTGLATVPEPLWWLLGAVVAFYFGARETHYLREHRPVGTPVGAPVSTGPRVGGDDRAPPTPMPTMPVNAALADWRAGQDESALGVR